MEYFLGLTPSGIVVLRNKTTVAHYFWPRIAKVYFKGRYFMLRVCDKNVSFYSNIYFITLRYSHFQPQFLQENLLYQRLSTLQRHLIIKFEHKFYKI